MRLRTIWTLPAMSLGERIRRTADLTVQGIARRLPARLRYHVLVQSGARAIRSDEVVPDVPFMDVLARTPGGPR